MFFLEFVNFKVQKFSQAGRESKNGRTMSIENQTYILNQI
jgi:hypothetical protein